MSEWKPGDTWGGLQQTRRTIEGLDRVEALVRFETSEADGTPLYFRWSVQDGARGGQILAGGWVDGVDGIEAAQRTADEATARLFPDSP